MGGKMNDLIISEILSFKFFLGCFFLLKNISFFWLEEGGNFVDLKTAVSESEKFKGRSRIEVLKDISGVILFFFCFIWAKEGIAESQQVFVNSLSIGFVPADKFAE